MITRVELENFKGIRDRIALDLRPITLLFGANSSGKSTVIHALHYALEVLASHNLDADRTTLGGDSVDLGGFRNLVHGHDLDRRIGMLFEFGIEGLLVDYTEGISDMSKPYRGPPGPNLEDADLDDRIFGGWVRFEIGWSRALGAPQVFSYEVGVNGGHDNPLIRVEAGSGKGQPASLVFRVADPVFGTAKSDETTEIADLVVDAGIRHHEGFASFPVYDQPSALPTWGRPLRLWLTDDLEPISASLVELRRIVSKLTVGIGELLIAQLERLLYVGPLRTVPRRQYEVPLTERLSRWAEGLGAWDALYRGGPNFVSRVSDWLSRLGTGYRLEMRRFRELDSGVASILESLVVQLRDLQDEEMARRGRPALGGRVVGARDRAVGARMREHLDASGDQWAVCLDSLQSARERVDLLLVDERNGVAVRPHDVGVGISQVLPVVVAALYRGARGAGSFVVVEQPELHIHPRLQVALADLFVEQVSAGTVSDHCFLLETHSEHLLLRLLRRIREGSDARGSEPPGGGTSTVGRGTSTGGLRAGSIGGIRGVSSGGLRAEGDQQSDEHSGVARRALTPDLISVVYVDRSEDGSTRFVPLRIDDQGEFLDVWPDGFFDERVGELYS